MLFTQKQENIFWVREQVYPALQICDNGYCKIKKYNLK